MADWLLKHIPQRRRSSFCDLKPKALKLKNKQ
ncbi:Uncharacterised protein [Klebsiella grimontii]|uniref:Uncharacterized protein n=1 Tax=Klebsiella grimontii TaxID=2058152 RepID=A0A7H4P2J5_9ENTR|nr:Uncharacterised protein [Klebsiella grimontii]